MVSGTSITKIPRTVLNKRQNFIFLLVDAYLVSHPQNLPDQEAYLDDEYA